MSQRQQNKEMQELKSTITSEMNSINIKDMLALALQSKQGRKPKQKGLFLVASQKVFKAHLLCQPAVLAVSPPEVSDNVNAYIPPPPPPQMSLSQSSAPPATPMPSIPSITINFSNSPSGSMALPSPSVSYMQPSQSSPLAPPFSPMLPPVALQDQSRGFSQSLALSEVDIMAQKWALMVAKYGDARLRKHHWDFVNNKYLPHYNFRPLAQIADVWAEWTEALMDICLCANWMRVGV
jgi:hypothetical protein